MTYIAQSCNYLHILDATAFASVFDGVPILDDHNQREYFKGCVLIGSENRIIGPTGISYRPEAFNAAFGGKLFIKDNHGNTTNRAWDAATNNPLFTIQKVDGTRFQPGRPSREITYDGLGRSYVNTYVPAKIETIQGDVTPFLQHVALILPVQNDQKLLIEYLAHCVKYPGYKIPWAPLIQSVEGVGKNVFKQVMRYTIYKQYFYQPKAKQLNDSGAKFNGWMEGKLFFLVDEIKTDEKRDLVETLKPLISEDELEIEGKGINQRMGDTPGNWLFFSNHRDAIPIHHNGRRWAIFYSAIQTVADLQARGMNDHYFTTLYNWLGDSQNGGHFYGLKMVAHYLLNYPIERGVLSSRAPQTSSTAEALLESRGWLETMIADAVEGDLQGFRKGWISSAAVARILINNRKSATPATIGKAIEALGYHRVGRAGRGWTQDNPNSPSTRAWLWNVLPTANVVNFGADQGYL
ncbi:MAG: primase-helicase family protein [Brucella anthropi]